jgi:hypothetical protein
MWSLLIAALALSSFFAGFPACAQPADAPAPAHLDLIIVRRFAAPGRIVALDPSLGFSLRRGQPGVPSTRRAASVARATSFTMAETITGQLRQLGYDAVQSDEAGPEPGGRALIVHGAFRSINEGHRRRFAGKDAGVAVWVEIDYQLYGGKPRRLSLLQLDSRQIPFPNRTSGDAGVTSAALRTAFTISRAVGELANRSNWPGVPR